MWLHPASPISIAINFSINAIQIAQRFPVGYLYITITWLSTLRRPRPPPPQIRKDSVKNVPTILWLEIQSSFHVWIWHGQSQTLLNRNFPRPTRIQFFFSLLLQFQPTCFTVANRLCPHLTVPNTAVLWAGRLKRTTEFSEKNDTSLFLPDTSVFGLVDTKDCLMPLFIDETVKLRGGQNL